MTSKKNDQQELIKVSEPIETANIYDALARCQGEFPVIPRDQTAKLKGVAKKTGKEYDFGYSYTSLGKLQEVTRPVLAKYGLCIFQTLTEIDGKLKLMTTLASVHNGDCIKDFTPIREIPDPQQMGSQLTYARRYSWERVLGISGMDDDDGSLAKAGTPGPQSQGQQQKSQGQQQKSQGDFPSTPQKMMDFWNARNEDRTFNATAHMWNALKGRDPDFNWPRGQDLEGWRNVYARLTEDKKLKQMESDPQDPDPNQTAEEDIKQVAGDQEPLFPDAPQPQKTGYENG